MKTRIAPLAMAAALALGATACDGNVEDDIENVQDNLETGADEVGDAIEDGGDAIEEGADEVGDDNGHTDGEE